MKNPQHNQLLNSIVSLIDSAHQRIAVTINSELTLKTKNK